MSMLCGKSGVVLRSTQPIEALTDEEFERFRTFARAACGLSLQPAKKALVCSRLERVVRRNGWGSYARYLDILSAAPEGPAWTEFIDCLTTNHTGFFREADHFTFLQKQVFPRVSGTLRIWSSACATGEEPYSIGIAAQEAGVRSFEILATDISRTALAYAEQGRYEETRLSGLDPALRGRYLVPVQGAQPRCFSVAERVRRCVQFRHFNLLAPTGPLGRFHVVFCRNVMIYFDRDTQESLVARLAERVEAGGFLLTGHSESLLRLPSSLEYVQPAIYRKVS